jgi:hypothetical protein
MQVMVRTFGGIASRFTSHELLWELDTAATRSHLIARWDEVRIQLRIWWQHNV